MNNLKFKTRAGVEVELTEDDMLSIHQHFEVQCTAYYLRENHEYWSEEKVQNIASETRRQMDSYGYDEDEAIEEVIKDYEKMREEMLVW